MDALLEPVSADKPTGVDLSFDTVYNDLAVLMEGTPENQFEPGSAKEPDWAAIRKLAEENLKRSKDLQIAIYYTVALTRTQGVEGAARGTELLAGIVRKYWDDLFPSLDPDDKDPTQRVNILSQLTVEQGSFGDPVKFIERLSAAPIFKVPNLAVTLEFLKHESTGDGKGSARLGEVMAAADPAEVAAGGASLRRVAAAVHAMDDFLIETLGRTSSPTFEPLIKALDRGLRIFEGLEPASGAVSDEEEAPPAEGAASAAADAGVAGVRAPAASGAIRSTEDVRKMLLKICDYYAANEPSSPVPILLKRAEGLVGKSFLDLVGNLSPNAVNEIKALMGPQAST